MSDYLKDLKEGQFPTMNLQKILESNEVPEFMKAITRNIINSNSGHYSLGEWIQKSSIIDIDCLERLCYVITDERSNSFMLDPRIEDMMGAMAVLSTKLFAIGEGLSSLTKDEEGVITRIALLQSYIAAEKLYRAGLPVKVYYENMSLDEDVNDVENLVIIEMFPQLKPGEENGKV